MATGQFACKLTGRFPSFYATELVNQLAGILSHSLERTAAHLAFGLLCSTITRKFSVGRCTADCQSAGRLNQRSIRGSSILREVWATWKLSGLAV